MRLLYGISVIVLWKILPVLTYSSGAPNSVCKSRTPSPVASYGHGADFQTGATDYEIEFTDEDGNVETSYTVGTEYRVKVKGTFEGLIMYAEDEDGLRYGKFLTDLPDNTKHLDCNDGPIRVNTTVTHSNKNSKTDTEFKWMPGAVSGGDIIFKATVVKEKDEFWAIESDEITGPDLPHVNTDFCPLMESDDNDDNGCHKPMPGTGCFILPHQSATCTVEDDNCQVIITWRADSTKAYFQMLAGSGTDVEYVCIGFSEDKSMGGDDIYCCQDEGSSVNVRRYKSTAGDDPPDSYATEKVDDADNPVNNEEASEDSGQISCRFERNLAGVSSKGIVDLSEPHYHFYAYGTTVTNDKITLHEQIPSISPRKIVIAEANRNYAKSLTEALSAEGCGDVKGCYKVSSCSGTNCEMLVMWTVDPIGDNILFEMTGKDPDTSKSSKWIAVAFSADKTMGADDVYACGCFGDDAGCTVKHLWNPGGNKPSILNFDNTPFNIEVKQDGGRISCRFMRPLTPKVSDGMTKTLTGKMNVLFAHGRDVDTTDNILKAHLSNHAKAESEEINFSNDFREFTYNSDATTVRGTIVSLFSLLILVATTTLLYI